MTKKQKKTSLKLDAEGFKKRDWAVRVTTIAETKYKAVVETPPSLEEILNSFSSVKKVYINFRTQEGIFNFCPRYLERTLERNFIVDGIILDSGPNISEYTRLEVFPDNTCTFSWTEYDITGYPLDASTHHQL